MQLLKLQSFSGLKLSLGSIYSPEDLCALDVFSVSPNPFSHRSSFRWSAVWGVAKLKLNNGDEFS